MDFEQTGWFFLSIGFVYFITYVLSRKQKLLSIKLQNQHMVSIVAWIFFGSFLIYESMNQNEFYYIFSIIIVLFVNLLSVLALISSWKLGKIYLKYTHTSPKEPNESEKEMLFARKFEKKNIDADDYFSIVGINDRVLWGVIYFQTLRTVMNF